MQGLGLRAIAPERDPMRKRIYVASPLKGDIAGNIERAAGYCRQVVEAGHIPYAPHLFYARFLDDTIAGERCTGMQMGQEELQLCDEVWAFGEPSEGMRVEIALATELEIPVRRFGPEGLRLPAQRGSV